MVTIDITNWEQDKVNMIQSMAVQILFQNSITYDDIKVDGGTIEVINPSTDFSKILTEDTISQAYDAWKVINDAAMAAAQAQANLLQQEMISNPLNTIQFGDIDVLIDGLKITDPQASAFLKTLTKYIKTRI